MLILEPRWKSYIVATAEPVLTPKQCDELIYTGQSEPRINANIGGKGKNEKIDYSYRKSIISWIPFAKATPIYQVIRQWMEVTNNNYFGFDTVQLSEQGQYAEYSKGGFYNWHMDSNIEMASMPTVRKISMTLLLSDPKDFEGGDLELFCGDTLDSEKNKFKLKRGYAVFFASFLLHRVMPVIKGNRKSLVMWFGGSPLR
jgi:PKHD-type hydroxylase